MGPTAPGATAAVAPGTASGGGTTRGTSGLSGTAQQGEGATGQGAGPAAPRPGGISITAPLNGHRVGHDEPPVIVVRGRVDDRSATAVVVWVNDLRITAPVVAGMFEAVVPGVESVVKLRAEVAGSANPKRSQEVVVHVDAASVPTAVLLFDWGRAASPPELDVRATWRSRSERTNDPLLPVNVKALPAYSSVFFMQNMKPGVYALSLGYRASDVPLSATVYLGGGGAKATAKPLRKLKLNGNGRTILARLLLPFNVLWDEDGWFTGRSESSTTVTKFRLPEGVSWVEEKPR